MNNDVKCFYNLSPRFVEQLRQGSQELGSECAVASRQRLLLVFLCYFYVHKHVTQNIFLHGIYISIVWDIGYFMDILYIPCIFVLFFVFVISTLVFGCLSWIFFHKI